MPFSHADLQLFIHGALAQTYAHWQSPPESLKDPEKAGGSTLST